MRKLYDFKDIIEIQDSFGNKFAKIHYDIMQQYSKYFQEELNSKYPVILNNEAFNGVAIYNKEYSNHYWLNQSYFNDFRHLKAFNPECLRDLNEDDYDTILLPDTFDETKVLYLDNFTIKLKDTFDEYLKTLNSKNRNNVTRNRRNCSNIEFNISTKPDEASFLYFVENGNKHNEYAEDGSLISDNHSFANSQILFSIAYHELHPDKTWFQTLKKDNSIVGYSSVLYMPEVGSLVHYAHCTEPGLGKFLIGNFVEYFCGKGYDELFLVSAPKFPWETEERDSNVYKKPFANSSKTTIMLSIMDIEDDKDVITFKPPFFRLNNSKWYA